MPSETPSAEVKGQVDKINVRGEEPTTPQRKPYFIKLENKNVILETNRLKKRKEWLEEEGAHGHRKGRDGWSAVSV